MTEVSGATAAVEQLYRRTLERWNARDARGFARLFDDEGHVIGFDGSEMDGPAEVEDALSTVFADHETGAYVANVRDVRLVASDIALLRAVVGMVPAAIPTVLARRSDGDWRVALLQNTPAQYHGREDAGDALTAELANALRAQ